MKAARPIRAQDSASVDVLIVGSGPVGATFARTLADGLPGMRILMIDAGPQLTSRPGMNVRNIADESERTRAQQASQGPTSFAYDLADDSGAAVSKARLDALAKLARPGTFLINGKPERPAELPGAASSSNVGGMGAHWTCACPRPYGSERIAFIPDGEMDRALAQAESLLHVRTDAFATSAAQQRILRGLGAEFGSPKGRPVAPMPMACTRLPTGERVWTGSDTILGPWAEVLDSDTTTIRLRSETICRRLLHKSGRVSGALIEHLPTGDQQEIAAKFIVVAADSLRSPQLLWASGIRPPALGHNLNEHPQILSAVQYAPAAGESLDLRDASELGVLWVPFREPGHGFHGQIMPLNVSPVPMGDEAGPLTSPLTIALCWFCRKDIQFDDRIEFSEQAVDYCAMPRMTMHYRYTERDHETFAAAIREQSRAAACIGAFVPGQQPSLLAAGRSLHYQGTMRMGAENDNQSVCDSYSRVWGFENLYVGGNGVIPTATACNPTLTTVALASRSAEHLLTRLSSQGNLS